MSPDLGEIKFQGIFNPLYTCIVSTKTTAAGGGQQIEMSMEMECCVRSYHVYGYVWEAAIGEELECQREPSNATDRYAVAVVKSGAVVGHLKVSCCCRISVFTGVLANFGPGVIAQLEIGPSFHIRCLFLTGTFNGHVRFFNHRQ